MYDDTMNKAAYVNELIRAQTNRPDCPTGSLHFVVQDRKTKKTERIILRYYYPPRNDLKSGIYTTETLTGMDDIILTVLARCNPKDQPRRFIGRTIALMRMARILAPLGYDVLAVWGKGKDAPHMVIPGNVQIPKDWIPQEVAERLWKQQKAAALRNAIRGCASGCGPVLTPDGTVCQFIPTARGSMYGCCEGDEQGG